MTVKIETKTDQIKTVTVSDNLGIALANGNQWITAADTGAVAVAVRLAKCIDTIFDTGDDLDKLAGLLGRFEGLLKQLKLTPLARDNASATVEEVDNGTKYAESYLRLINTTDSNPKPKRANTGTSSKRVSK